MRGGGVVMDSIVNGVRSEPPVCSDCKRATSDAWSVGTPLDGFCSWCQQNHLTEIPIGHPFLVNLAINAADPEGAVRAVKDSFLAGHTAAVIEHDIWRAEARSLAWASVFSGKPHPRRTAAAVAARSALGDCLVCTA